MKYEKKKAQVDYKIKKNKSAKIIRARHAI